MREPTVVANPARTTAVLAVLFVVGGSALVGGVYLAVQALLDGFLDALGSSFLPMVDFVAKLPELWGTIAAFVVGAAGGGSVARRGRHESLTLTVADDEVGVLSRRVARVFPRGEVKAAFLDEGDLVLLGSRTEELYREPCDQRAGAVGRAFAEHGYEWLPEDPHKAEFRIWVPGTPGMPAGADELFRAREFALSKKDKMRPKTHALKEQLADLDIVVLDRGTTKYWRFAEHWFRLE
ncbi:hypothetical protein V5P93_003397 [Actinokineospora auranticolor]|uniref:Uncharacterized protein n=1 Tax=Actinokineospora auranticolor TaxID=155976 RepID=A0A2S6GPA1_9PSEU|nr:hypothetical protein [Actinokineospora auranticolor]PPK67058.1 hypothetical protein CLV40_10855 [Actinokineospora auranticolor]